MADGVQKKYALIINGDTETRHLANVDRAVAALKQEDPGYQISLLSTQRPKKPVTQYAQGGVGALQKLIKGLGSKLDQDDLLVVYVTGHGKEGEKNEGCIGLPDGCYSLEKLKTELAKVPYGKRIVVMDQCFSGKGFSFFADRKSTVVTQGSPNEAVSCELFSPFFWSDQVKDADGDGVITVQERYAYAIAKGKTPTLTQYFSEDLAIAFSGKRDRVAPFPAKVLTVHKDKDLRKQLKRLQPGQLALVMFSADWCQPCKEYFPTFQKLARKYGGRFLTLLAEQHQTDAEWNKFNISAFPTLAFIDFRGKVTPVGDLKNPLASLLRASLYDLEQEIQVFGNGLQSFDKRMVIPTLKGLKSLKGEGAALVPQIIPLLFHSDREVRRLAIEALGEIGPAAAAAVPALDTFLNHKDFRLRFLSIQALAKIGKPSKEAIRNMLAMLKPSFINELVRWAIHLEPEAFWIDIKGLIFEYYKIVGAALGVMGKKDPSILPQLVALLKDPKSNEMARFAAIQAIDLMGEKGVDAFSVLQQYAMHDASLSGVGTMAFDVCLKIAKAHPETIIVLIREMTDPQLHPYHRFSSAMMIYNFLTDQLSEDHLGMLIQVAMDEKNPPTLRSIAAQIIQRIGTYTLTPEMTEELLQLANNYPGDIRNKGLKPPPWYSKSTSLTLALPLIADPAPKVRVIGTMILLEETDPIKFNYLLGLSKDPGAEVRRWAAVGLTGIRNYGSKIGKFLPPIKERLITLLQDENKKVRLTAFKALIELKELLKKDWSLIQQKLFGYAAVVDDEEVLADAMAYAKKRDFKIPEEVTRRKKSWTVMAAPLIESTLGEGWGWGGTSRVDFRWDHLGLQAQLSATDSAAQGLRLSGALGPLWYFKSRHAPGKLDPYLSLPAIGLTKNLQTETKERYSLTLYPAGIGMRWFLWNQLSLDGSLQGGVEFPLGEGDLTAGLQSQWGLAWGF